jgi:hypothetical protein
MAKSERYGRVHPAIDFDFRAKNRDSNQFLPVQHSQSL